jgi:hypothetical protein
MSHFWRYQMDQPRMNAEMARAMVVDMGRELFFPGRVVLAGWIDEGLERDVRRQIDRAMRDADELELLINSEGGLIGAAERIARDVAQCPATAIVSGICDSAALRPLLACGYRTGDPYSTYLLHSAGSPDADLNYRLNAKFGSQLANAGIRLADPLWAALHRHSGHRISAATAKRCGLLDCVQ